MTRECSDPCKHGPLHRCDPVERWMARYNAANEIGRTEMARQAVADRRFAEGVKRLQDFPHADDYPGGDHESAAVSAWTYGPGQ